MVILFSTISEGNPVIIVVIAVAVIAVVVGAVLWKKKSK